jgi:AP-1-like factor
MSDLEARLAKLKVQHNDLAQSYECLQLEYSTVKEELETLRGSYSKQESLSPDPGSYDLGSREWEETWVGDFLSWV